MTKSKIISLKMIKWFGLYGLLVWCGLTLSGAAGAVEFSAQMLLKDGNKTMPGKLYIKEGKMRQEFLDEEGQTITIVRPDKKVVWVIMYPGKTYMEMPLKRELPGQFLQIPPDAFRQRKVGTETVNGYLTDKYEVMLKGGTSGLIHQTFWVAPKLGVPVKMVSPLRKYSLEYRNIKEGKVPDRLFELPPGYRKLPGPSGYPLRRWD
ncbi:MAG: DUF4412 domain-containing protein [Thermodesulfobacteriota bacterium]